MIILSIMGKKGYAEMRRVLSIEVGYVFILMVTMNISNVVGSLHWGRKKGGMVKRKPRRTKFLLRGGM